MIKLSGLRLNVGEREKKLRAIAARELGIREEDIAEFRILRKSLDARKKNGMHWQYSVAVKAAGDEERLISGCKNAGKYEPYNYNIPSVKNDIRPVVVGFGPAGMFASLVLAQAGLRPIVLERGGDIEFRQKAVESFWNGGDLDERSNVQFGEGGAGTFSDGKLNTGTHDPRISFVLETLHRFGAPENICYDAKPHVGTDILRRVVKNLRLHIVSLGAEVRFFNTLTGLEVESGVLKGIHVSSPEGDYSMECCRLLLCPGHSARDTFEMLLESGMDMERKGFSMGVRIEHLQRKLGKSQYGENYRFLPPADYKINCRLPNGKSAYSFCMCPGGYVVAAASESGGVCTNGMSYSGRAGENANAALLVTLMPEDFPGNDILAGVEWQKKIERACYDYGGGNYNAPAQRLGDFLENRPSSGPGSVHPSYRPGVVWGSLRDVLPDEICDTLAAAIPMLSSKLKCFDDPDAVLTAPETRSSSPVRIIRNGEMCAPAAKGLYPCGEGAGYAGGITSAAVDGMRAAEAVISSLS